LPLPPQKVHNAAMSPHSDAQNALREVILLHRAGDIAEAAARYRALLPDMPSDARLQFLLGTAELQLGHHAECVARMEQALALQPDNNEALCNLGVGLRELGRYAEALAALERAVVLKPDKAILHLNSASVLHALKRPDDALAAIDRAIELAPANPEAFNNRGAILRDMLRLEEALAAYNAALGIRPDYIEALSNRGNVLKLLGRFGEAMASFDRALALRPDYVSALWNKGLLELLLGHYAAGWDLYEWRWRRESMKTDIRDYHCPQWTGAEPLAGKRLLVHAEQGYGDVIQFCRYAPLALDLGARVIVEAKSDVLPLLKTLKGRYEFIAKGDPLPECDLHCPMMSLPRAFGTRLETVPADSPYLFADPDKQAAWREKLGERTAPRIGLVWSGRPFLPGVPYRSIPLHRFAPLLRLQFDFHALQKTVNPEDTARLPEFPNLHVHCEDIRDFSDTAALAAEMDVVISIDTSAVHVAGSLGLPVWVLLVQVPEWRWLMDRSDSPWYPTARLFRQPAKDDWDSVMATVRRELKLKFQ
jgi:tetratricopeptide (TPR) repeat protein